jgi:hypothetical protein
MVLPLKVQLQTSLIIQAAWALERKVAKSSVRMKPWALMKMAVVFRLVTRVQGPAETMVQTAPASIRQPLLPWAKLQEPELGVQLTDPQAEVANKLSKLMNTKVKRMIYYHGTRITHHGQNL